MIKTYRIGTLKITEFQNENSTGYKIEKSYKDKDSGEWKDTTNMFFEDLLKLKSIIGKIENDTTTLTTNDTKLEKATDLDDEISF